MTLREFWGLILYSKWLVIAMTLVGLAGGLAYASYLVPTYTSQVTVAYTTPEDLAGKYGVSINVDPNIIQSTASIAKIKQSLAQPGSFQAVKATASEDKNTIVFAVWATSQADARTAATAAAGAYIADLQNQFETAVKQLDAKAEALKITIPNPEEGDEAGKAERDAILSTYRDMKFWVAAASQAPPPATVRIAAQQATLSSVSSPVVVAVGALLGMFLGVAAWLERKALDTRLRSTASNTHNR
ncbi:MAG: Wzz/FepE/Etk N-terminal domain-containing protein, partial [Micrococcales bacterium]|nr:Wzz/FepE/Etk N-terminal domain-containing protein [Micrococcales bacterium]